MPLSSSQANPQHRLTVRLAEPDYLALVLAAEGVGCSLSEFIRQSVLAVIREAVRHSPKLPCPLHEMSPVCTCDQGT